MFFVFRLEGQEWIKLIEIDWYSRESHECQMLDKERLAILGGEPRSFRERFDILDLKSLILSRVGLSL